jgi:hypothetical protein
MLLKNKSLRDLLMEIDDSRNRETTLMKHMMDPPPQHQNRNHNRNHQPPPKAKELEFFLRNCLRIVGGVYQTRDDGVEMLAGGGNK